MGLKVTTTLDGQAGMAALGREARRVVIIGQSGSGTDNKLVDIFSKSQALTEFTSGNIVDILIESCFPNRIERVAAVKIANILATDTQVDIDAKYKTALDAILAEKQIGLIILDTNASSVVGIAKTHCDNATAENRPRKLVSWGGTTEAGSANSGRVWVVDDNVINADGADLNGMHAAAAVATVISLETDPALPVHGLKLRGFGGVKTKKTIAEMDTLADGGVIPLEQVGGDVVIYRGVTSYTKDSTGNPDPTYSDISTMEIIDTVVPGVQRYLQNKYKRSKNTDGVREQIESDVKTVLLSYEDLEYIEEVEESSNISATAVVGEPKKTRVDYNFNVVNPLEEIQIYAHMIL
jgi:phage tail sheath gpL-like